MTLLIFLAVFIYFFLLRAKISFACMTVLVGRKASESGNVLVAHNEDAPGRYTMQTHLVHKLRRHPGTTIKFEPDTAELELNPTRTSLLWSEAKTYNPDKPEPSFCDLYVNGFGVVICSNNCADSKEDSPELFNGGIAYGLRRLVAEKAMNARDALNIACDLVDKYGYASSGRSYAFADCDEIFVMQIVHGKHYAIQRVPDDEAAIIPNHYTIHDCDKKARGYNELVNYAIKRGWHDPENIFDFAKVYQSEATYGLEKNTHRHVRAFEILLDIDLSGLLDHEWESLPFSIKPAHKVNIDTLKKILRTHFEGTSSNNSNGNTPHFDSPLTICNIDTLESTIAEIRRRPERIILRKALGRPCFAPYVPFYFGINSIPEGYEDVESEKSLREHFNTQPQDLDYRNNAWFMNQEVQAACDLLYPEKSEIIREKISEVESVIEKKLSDIDPQIELRIKTNPYIAGAMIEGAVMSWAEDAKNLMNELKSELAIIPAEAENNISPEKNFVVRINNDKFDSESLDISQCRCGPSYLPVKKWSECLNIVRNDKFFTLKFADSEWIHDAVPCFMDLYILLVNKDGSKRAATVKIKILEV